MRPRRAPAALSSRAPHLGCRTRAPGRHQDEQQPRQKTRNTADEPFPRGKNSRIGCRRSQRAAPRRSRRCWPAARRCPRTSSASWRQREQQQLRCSSAAARQKSARNHGLCPPPHLRRPPEAAGFPLRRRTAGLYQERHARRDLHVVRHQPPVHQLLHQEVQEWREVLGAAVQTAKNMHADATAATAAADAAADAADAATASSSRKQGRLLLLLHRRMQKRGSGGRKRKLRRRNARSCVRTSGRACRRLASTMPSSPKLRLS